MPKTNIEILKRAREVIVPAQKRLWDFLEGLGDADDWNAVERTKMMLVIARAIDESNQLFLRSVAFTSYGKESAGPVEHPLVQTCRELQEELKDLRRANEANINYGANLAEENARLRHIEDAMIILRDDLGAIGDVRAYAAGALARK